MNTLFGEIINLLTSNRLNTYLAEIDDQVHECFERLVEHMEQVQVQNSSKLERLGLMNNIRACAREVVEKEIIYA